MKELWFVKATGRGLGMWAGDDGYTWLNSSTIHVHDIML
jgi:hypothetical protein